MEFMKKNWGIGLLVLGIFLINFVSANEKISEGIFSSEEKIKVNILFEEDKNIRKISSSSEDIITKIKTDKKTKHFQYSDAISVELNYDEILELSDDPSVKFISEIRNFSISLAESIQIVNASSVWETQITNVNLTGEGQTVCIIDTGINFSHADLSSNYLGGYDFVNEDDNPSDDHGHGTHVAGIVAANGLLKGVAPNAGIIAIKVLDENGNGNDADIISGIEWCISNASTYNISVISMSLGTSCPGPYCYSSYCDSNPLETLMVDAINSAVAQNISVIVASGNDANYTHISSPACASNATPVGDSYDKDVGGLIWGNPSVCTDATTFVDKIVCHANRNSLVSLFAPGAIINSSWFDGRYKEAGGTSMATPMVAGAFLLIKQKLALIDEQRTPSEIEQILNSTGVVLEDSGYSGLNFSRIDIFAAIESIEYSLIGLNSFSPQNNSYTNINETNFSCSAYSNFNNLTNMTFYLFNSTSLIFNETKNLEGFEDEEIFNFTFLNEENYIWYCEVFNNNSDSYRSENYSITYDVSFPAISIEPVVTVTSSSATISWTTDEATNTSLSYGSSLSNASFSTSHSEIISGLSASTSYNYNVSFCDRAGNCNSTDGSFTTSTAPVVRSSGGGGGGGSSAKTYEIELVGSENKILSNGDKLTFNKSGEKHVLTLNKIINNSINLTIQSEPVNFVLLVGETKKLNLSSSEYFDLEIKLKNISSGKANLTLKEIYENIFPVEDRFSIQNKSSGDEKDYEIEKEFEKEILVFVFALVLWIWFVGVVIKKTDWKRLKTEETNKKNEKSKTKTKRKR